MTDEMTTETTDAAENAVTITDAGPCLKKLVIEIPAEAVSAKLGESLDTLSYEAQLPGFRKGRVPRRLIERRFGDKIRDEAKNQLIAQAYSQAVEANELKVLGEPAGEGLADLVIEDGKPLKIELDVEVLPEFELPKLEGIAVKRPVVEVTEETVSEEVERMKINEGRLEQRDEPEPGDYLTGHGIMKGPDGTEHHNINGAVVRLPLPEDNGAGMILGIAVEDFDAQFGRPKTGDIVTVKAKGPENHEIEAVRGADLTMTFEIERIDRIIPATIEQVLSAYGLDSEDQLREAIDSRINQRAMIEQQSVMRQQVAGSLLENTPMELPAQVTANQAVRTLERRRLELMHRGVDPIEIEQHIAELRAASHADATRELKLYFILNKVAEDMSVSVDEAEINGRIAQMAAQRNVRPEQLRQELIQTNQVSGIYQQIREHKTLDAILAKAEIEEMPADEFNAFMEKQAGEGAEQAG